MARVAEPFEESEGATSRCRRKALDLLARRPHFRRQLEEKLRVRGFAEDDVAGVCDRLEESGLLDDLECARSLASGTMRRKRFGPRRLRAELMKRGAPEFVVEEVVTESFREGEKALLRESAIGWLRRHQWDRSGLARHLERRGFSAGAIVSTLADLESQGANRATGEVD